MRTTIQALIGIFLLLLFVVLVVGYIHGDVAFIEALALISTVIAAGCGYCFATLSTDETRFVIHKDHEGLRQFVRDIQEMLES